MILNARGISPTEDAIQKISKELGYDQPLIIQYFSWFKNILKLDFGYSIKTNTSVLEELLFRFLATVELAFISLFTTVVVSLIIGTLAAIYKNTVIDYIGRIVALIGSSMPSFWLGIILIYIFAVKLKILPVTGRGNAKHIILPAITLSFGMIAIYVRMLRSKMLDTLNKEFVFVARAKGLKEWLVILRHVLGHSILSVITLIGINLGSLLGGTVIVETIFSWPGVGKYVIDAIKARDYPVIQGFTLLMTVMFVLINLIVDISYAFLDPRIRNKIS